MQVGDKILVHSGMLQNETGTVVEIIAVSGYLRVAVDGWPGHYVVRPSECYRCGGS